MSHSVTVTRTVTTSGGTHSYFVVNRGYFCSVSGVLKIVETVVGSICLALIAYFCRNAHRYANEGFSGVKEEALFFIVTFAFLVTTFLLLLASFCSAASAAILPKSTFEYLYHLVAFIFYLSSSLALLIETSNRKGYYRTTEYGYEGKMAAAVLGLVNSVLYLLSFIFSIRHFRIA